MLRLQTLTVTLERAMSEENGNNKPLLLTVREAALLLRIHRPKVYDLIKDGTIEGFKLGSDWRIKRASLERLVGAIPDDFFSGKEEEAEEAKSEAA